MNNTICYKCIFKCKCCQYGGNYPMTIKCKYCDIEHPMFKLNDNFIKQCPQVKHYRCDKCENHQQELNFIYCPIIQSVVKPEFYCAHYKEKENE